MRQDLEVVNARTQMSFDQPTQGRLRRKRKSHWVAFSILAELGTEAGAVGEASDRHQLEGYAGPLYPKTLEGRCIARNPLSILAMAGLRPCRRCLDFPRDENVERQAAARLAKAQAARAACAQPKYQMRSPQHF